MQLAVFGHEPVRTHNAKAVIKTIAIPLDEPGRYCRFRRARNSGEPFRGWSARHAFSKRFDFRARQVFEERVAGDRTLIEADQLCALPGGLPGQRFDSRKVVVFVPVPHFELCGADSDFPHTRFPFDDTITAVFFIGMQFLPNSLLELITQTSTNLPPDVREAMSRIAAAEKPGTQSSQALDIILSNIDMACDDEGPICQDTGMPTFFVHTPVGVNQIEIKKAIRAAVAEATRRGKLRPNSVDSLTGKNSGDNL